MSIIKIHPYMVDETQDFTFHNVTATGTITSSNLPLVFNDISNQFDGAKTVFPLKIDQTVINTIVDSKDVEVSVNGQILSPFVTEIRYPWMSPYDSGTGFRIASGNIIIYNAPSPGSSATLIARNTSQTIQTRRYPYSASTIAFGD